MSSTSSTTDERTPSAGAAGGDGAAGAAGADGAAGAAGAVLVGHVRRPHGVRGEVVVEELSDVEGRFAPGALLWLAVAGAERRRLEVADARRHKGTLLVRFAGYEDRDAAEELRGADLEVDAGDVPPAPEGTWYHFELVGCRLVDAEAGELGRVVEVVEDGGGDMLVVEGPRGRIPVPLVRAFVDRVDVAAGVIEVALPPGLVETCASAS